MPGDALAHGSSKWECAGGTAVSLSRGRGERPQFGWSHAFGHRRARRETGRAWPGEVSKTDNILYLYKLIFIYIYIFTLYIYIYGRGAFPGTRNCAFRLPEFIGRLPIITTLTNPGHKHQKVSQEWLNIKKENNNILLCPNKISVLYKKMYHLQQQY